MRRDKQWERYKDSLFWSWRWAEGTPMEHERGLECAIILTDGRPALVSQPGVIASRWPR